MNGGVNLADVVSLLTTLSQRMNDLHKKVDFVVKNISATTTTVTANDSPPPPPPPIESVFTPIDTEERLIEFEEKLRTNIDYATTDMVWVRRRPRLAK